MSHGPAYATSPATRAPTSRRGGRRSGSGITPAWRLFLEAVRADAVRDHVPLGQRHHLDFKVVPDAVDRAPFAPRTDRHLQAEEVARRRNAGSGSAGSAR